jgi:hypothetical protein
MWKKALVGAAAFTIAGAMTVYAQQPPAVSPEIGGLGSPGDTNADHDGVFPDARIAAFHARFKLNADDIKAFADARIAALHAGLELNETQEKLWPGFEQALRDFLKSGIHRFIATRDKQPSFDPIQRLQLRADALIARGAALKHLGDTAAPIYQSLDDGQKRRFAILARFMQPHPRNTLAHRHGMNRHSGMRDGGNIDAGAYHAGGREDMHD